MSSGRALEHTLIRCGSGYRRGRGGLCNPSLCLRDIILCRGLIPLALSIIQIPRTIFFHGLFSWGCALDFLYHAFRDGDTNHLTRRSSERLAGLVPNFP
jgi:hypothetical protein